MDNYQRGRAYGLSAAARGEWAPIEDMTSNMDDIEFVVGWNSCGAPAPSPTSVVIPHRGFATIAMRFRRRHHTSV
jgi:hypothetical protein